ncbi:MAG TPA: hypothetical protein VMZ28_13960 [Kofleriaceae bacterium]|nr:hypothetical protein [Kofleriaceae bacterium]
MTWMVAVVALVAAAGARPARADAQDDRLGGTEGGWRASTGLRIDQQATPRDGGLALGVRLTLPEVARGSLSVETFRWERLDVTQDRSALGEDQGTVYQVLGARQSFDGSFLGAFVGAHVMTWSGDSARGVTPWLGGRVGRLRGARLEGEARLLGVAAIDPQPGENAGDLELAVRVSSVPFFRWRLGARARHRDLAQPGGRRRDTAAALGLELSRAGRPIFVGLGAEHLVAPPAEMALAGTRATVLLVQLEVDAGLLPSLVR